MQFKQSEKWNHVKSAQELLEGKNVLFNFNYRAHKSDEGYGKFAIYVEHELSNNDYTIINIDEDGLVYNGDSSPCDDTLNKLVSMSSEEAYKILLDYKNLVEARDKLESRLRKYTDDDCVNIIIDSSYILEKQYRK